LSSLIDGFPFVPAAPPFVVEQSAMPDTNISPTPDLLAITCHIALCAETLAPTGDGTQTFAIAVAGKIIRSKARNCFIFPPFGYDPKGGGILRKSC
jgi:hypothetical protein